MGSTLQLKIIVILILLAKISYNRFEKISGELKTSSFLWLVRYLGVILAYFNERHLTVKRDDGYSIIIPKMFHLLPQRRKK